MLVEIILILIFSLSTGNSSCETPSKVSTIFGVVGTIRLLAGKFLNLFSLQINWFHLFLFLSTNVNWYQCCSFGFICITVMYLEDKRCFKILDYVIKSFTCEWPLWLLLWIHIYQQLHCMILWNEQHNNVGHSLTHDIVLDSSWIILLLI